MARIYGIKKGLAKNGIDDRTIKEIIGNGNLVNVIERMENTLDSDTLHQILDANACTGGKEYLKRCEKIGKEISDKTLSEKRVPRKLCKPPLPDRIKAMEVFVCPRKRKACSGNCWKNGESRTWLGYTRWSRN